MATSEISGGEPPERAERRGRVRFRRAALMGVPAVAAAATLVILTAQGAIAAQFAISGMPFTVTADRLEGQGFEQFGGMDNMAEGSPNAGDTGGQVLVVVSAIKKAKLTKLCQSVEIGGTYLHITAGDKGTPVFATDLTTDSTVLTGNQADFDNIEIGGDASTFTKAGVKGPLGVFGQQADTVTITNLRQTNWATTAAKFRLPNLHLSFSSKGC
ncbi:DUF6230 family protein [Streptomyces scopuliridis]|uniref:DUF6230 family protein n=1 Tax=Streptomyces scopuliridis TaxID=452529 RepID=A0ACD4ZWM4_9ACTN|nr:DUF6230 family protein [Streptomyces scopuliridis]WSB38187.1 DUF6230 family protein [Streptomyces scopuliridis]WSC02620.1 DUF6230 family protein [Streptomyces scopuliridis]WSC03848.1 DUF6230 family protein [Streptomyces scopuliridis]